MRGRLVAATVALAVGSALLVTPLTAAPATAAPARCAAYGDVVRETSAGGALAGRTPLLVGSYNIAGYNASKGSQPAWEKRAAKLVGMILRCSPDVIGLQEASEAWMQRRPAGARNYAQYENVVDLMNSRTQGSPYRVTNTNRKVCPTTGPNPAVWNGFWQGYEASWRTCTTAPSRSSSDNRTVYDSRVLSVVSHGAGRLSSATSMTRTVDWTIFEVRATGRRFVMANTHLDARYRNKAVNSATSDGFRRKQAAQLLSVLRKVRAHEGATLPAVVVGDLNSGGRNRARTAVDDMTKAGLIDVLGTDRKVYRGKRTKWRGSCKSVGSTSTLTPTGNLRVPLHLTRRIHAYYDTSNALQGKIAGTATNSCMFRDKKFRKPRGTRATSYYKYQGTRIDYVLTSGFRARGWETVVDANLRRAKYASTPPSDHNMVAASLVV